MFNKAIKYTLFLFFLGFILSLYTIDEETKDVRLVGTLNQRAVELYQDGKYAEAIDLAKTIWLYAEKHLGEQHQQALFALNNLGHLYQVQGQYLQAQPLLQRAVRIREQVLGKEHPDTLTSINNLAGLYQAQGRYEKAESLYQRALPIRE